MSKNSNKTDLTDHISVIGGAIYGIVAFVGGFIINTLLLLFEFDQNGELSQMTGEHALSYLSWFFYNAHSVTISTENDVGAESLNLLEFVYATAPAAQVPKLTYYVVPFAILFLLGFSLAKRATSDSASSVGGAIAGASIALGYLTASVLGSVSIATITEAGQSAGPELGSVVIFMGILYPGVAGGIGGYIAG